MARDEELPLAGAEDDESEDGEESEGPKVGMLFVCAIFGVLIGVGATLLAINFSTPMLKSYLGLLLPKHVMGTQTPASLYEAVLKDARYFDLTHAMSPVSPVWVGFGPMSASASVAGGNMDGFIEKGDQFTYHKTGFQATQYHLTTDQFGTQLDPPAHWNEFGATISDLPATFALRPLVVIDISTKVKADAKYAAKVSDVEAYEATYGKIAEGSVVFFRSDWSKDWAAGPPQLDTTVFPGVSLDVLKFLHLERKILFHGHEPLDTDTTPLLDGEAWLMHNNFAQAEGVCCLEEVDAAGCLLSIGFAKFLGGTGGYARYIAICPGHGTGGERIADKPGAPLMTQAHPLRRPTSGALQGVLQPDPDAKKTDYCGPGPNGTLSVALGCPTSRWAPAKP